MNLTAFLVELRPHHQYNQRTNDFLLYQLRYLLDTAGDYSLIGGMWSDNSSNNTVVNSGGQWISLPGGTSSSWLSHSNKVEDSFGIAFRNTFAMEIREMNEDSIFFPFSGSARRDRSISKLLSTFLEKDKKRETQRQQPLEWNGME